MAAPRVPLPPPPLLLLLLLLAAAQHGLCAATDVAVRLAAPRWVARGGAATLRCLHQVPPPLLYKVEFLRAGAKLLQYVRERRPPFSPYAFPGGRINVSLASPEAVTLERLEPAASGLYWCEVSLETPIFTAASAPHRLTVVYAQKHPPIITFGKPDVVVGGFIRANCTSAPAAPAPRLSWYIDNEKVPEEAVRHFSYRVSSSTRSRGGHRHRKHQHRYIAPEFNYTARYWALVSDTTPAQQQQPAQQPQQAVNASRAGKCTLGDGRPEYPPKQPLRERPAAGTAGAAGAAREAPVALWVSVAELRTPARGRLTLTCTATIPDDVAPGEKFADVKKQTVTVAVNELSAKRPRQESSAASAATPAPRPRRCGAALLLVCGALLLRGPPV